LNKVGFKRSRNKVGFKQSRKLAATVNASLSQTPRWACQPKLRRADGMKRREYMAHRKLKFSSSLP
jgi:hypothetical protein